jgi:soluble lytic murein transglycosylase-like protein
MTPAVAWRTWLRPCAVALLCLVALPLHAQVWGYVDERGVAHFAADRLDARYELFYRGDVGPAASASLPEQAGAATALAYSGLLPAERENSGWETPELVGTAFPETGAVVAPARLLAFFQVSPAYKAVRHHIRDAARANGIAPELLQAVIAAESGFDAQAISPRGAVGLMQIMPVTAQAHGLAPEPRRTVESQLADPRTNIHTGARILARLLGQFPEQVDLALAAYNAGEGAVRRAGGQVPNYPETRKYVRTVTQLYQYLQPPRGLQRRAAQSAGQQHARVQP